MELNYSEIDRLRKEKKFTIEDFSKKIGLSYPATQKMLKRGYCNNVKYSNLEQIADVLEVDINSLYFTEDVIFNNAEDKIYKVTKLIIDRIHAKRKEKKITIEELGKKIGLSYQGMQSFFKRGELKISTLQKIADILEVDMATFFKDEPIINKGINAFLLLDNEKINQSYLWDKFVPLIYFRLCVLYSNILFSDIKTWGINDISEHLQSDGTYVYNPQKMLKSMQKYYNSTKDGDKFKEKIKEKNAEFVKNVFDINEGVKWLIDSGIATLNNMVLLINEVLYNPEKD